MKVYLADYGMRSLKKFCKLFANYSNVNNWSPPEVWDTDNATPETQDRESVDSYSFGMLIWELETGDVPFEGLDVIQMRSMLLDKKLRPMIPENTDQNLSLLIRRCWQDNA